MGEYYAVTRSPEYLEHFGILGMKWGVRRFQNKDGSLTPEGIERYRKTNALQKDLIKKTFEKIYVNDGDMSGIDKLFSITGASEDAKNKTYDICKEYSKEVKDLSGECDKLLSGLDDSTRAYYAAATEIASFASWYKEKPGDLMMEDIGNNGFMACLEDGQQQPLNATSYFLQESGKYDKAFELVKKSDELYKSSRENLKETLSDAFGEVGADEIDDNHKLSNSLSWTMLEKSTHRDHSKSDGYYDIMFSVQRDKPTESELKSVDEAKKIISHFDGSHDSNTWWYVNEAAENLGLSSTKAGDMTQADWDRINAEIRKLRSLEHSAFRDEEFLAHHGILGMKWGVRRFQNPDGSLTEEGRRRYGDILTKDQMNNLIKSYNLRTGKKKKINKNTIFKTPNGTYDYKGRRINTDTDVDDPGKKKDKNTKPKKLSEMSDAELAAANARMKAETEYNKYYKELNPQKESLAKKFMNNTIDSMTEEVPKAVAKAAGDYLRKWITGEIDSATSGKDQSGKKDQDQQTDSKKNQQSNKSGNQQSNKSDNQQSSTSDKQQDSNESPIKSVSGMNVAGIKIPNAAELGSKVGRVEDLIRDGLNDYQADFNKAKDKASNYTKEKRRSMADTAVTNLEKSIKGTLDPSGRAAVNRALSGVLRNASGSEYNKQSTFDSIVKDAYYNQVALEFMSDFGLKSLDQIRNY